MPFFTEEYFKHIAKQVEENVDSDDVDLTSFELKTELNPKFWNEGELNKRIRRELLSISKDFIEDLELDELEIEDIIMTGSLANYNWNEDYSDIDLHIVIDFSSIDAPGDIVKKFFDDERKKWNDSHDKIDIAGFPVELYVQDTREKHTSSGVYSILNNSWLVEPSINKIENKNLDKQDIREQVAEFMNKIDELDEDYKSCESNSEYEDIHERATELFNEIKTTRQSSMAKSNKEMSEGNIVFKALRRNEYIKKLIDIKVGSYDLMHSVNL